MAAAVSWLPAPTASLMEGGRRIANMERKRSLSGETPGGRCCLSFPMRTLGFRPWISMGRRSTVIQSRTAICSFQTVQAKCFSNMQMAQQSHCRHLRYPKYPGGHAWAGLRERWRIWAFTIWSLPLQTGPRWGGTRCEVPPHCRDKAWPEQVLLQRQGWSNFHETCLKLQKRLARSKG